LEVDIFWLQLTALLHEQTSQSLAALKEWFQRRAVYLLAEAQRKALKMNAGLRERFDVFVGEKRYLEHQVVA